MSGFRRTKRAREPPWYEQILGVSQLCRGALHLADAALAVDPHTQWLHSMYRKPNMEVFFTCDNTPQVAAAPLRYSVGVTSHGQEMGSGVYTLPYSTGADVSSIWQRGGGKGTWLLRIEPPRDARQLDVRPHIDLDRSIAWQGLAELLNIYVRADAVDVGDDEATIPSEWLADKLEMVGSRVWTTACALRSFRDAWRASEPLWRVARAQPSSVWLVANGVSSVRMSDTSFSTGVLWLAWRQATVVAGVGTLPLCASIAYSRPPAVFTARECNVAMSKSLDLDDVRVTYH